MCGRAGSPLAVLGLVAAIAALLPPPAPPSNKVVSAVQAGGVIRFACGPKPVTIQMKATAKVSNTSRRVVLDGGGLVTLSGEGRRRILYMDTCDKTQTWTTSHSRIRPSRS